MILAFLKKFWLTKIFSVVRAQEKFNLPILLVLSLLASATHPSQGSVVHTPSCCAVHPDGFMLKILVVTLLSTYNLSKFFINLDY